MTGVLERAGVAWRQATRAVRELGPEADLVRAYWRKQPELKLPAVPCLDGAVLSSLCTGLGDTLMLTDVPRASRGTVPVFSVAGHFRPLMKWNPWWKDSGVAGQLLLVNAPTVVRHYATGNGHYLQRLRRAFRLPVDPVPRGCLAWKGHRWPKRVVMHFEAGPHARWQRQNIKAGARQLSRQSRLEIEKWVAQERGLEFIMVGRPPEGGPLKGVRCVKTPTLDDLVNRVGECGWFVGIVSGVMHLATAMQLRCVVLVDFPEAHRIMLPTLKQTGQLEEEWLYPQNCHLHQEGDGPLVKRLSVDNMKRAMDGELYPYWRADYAELVEERL